jgi:4-azaleucine resistance transporter AzlC
MDIQQFKEGAKAALPIVLGYLPVGMAFGVVARKVGLTTFEAGLMSVLVYAGASQFVAIEMISKGISWFPIVIATFFINLWHLLMSSTLSLYFKKSRLRTLSLLSGQLTDESFARAMSNTSKISNRPSYLFGLQMTSQIAWIAGSVVGALSGKLIDQKEYGIPFALSSLFICLLVIQIKKARHLWVMVMAGISSILFKWAFPGNWYILLTGLLASGIGMAIETKLVPSPLMGEGEDKGEK